MTTMTSTLTPIDLYDMTSMILSSPRALRVIKAQLRDFRIVSGKELSDHRMSLDRYRSAYVRIGYQPGVLIEKVFNEDECPLPVSSLHPWPEAGFVIGLFASTLARVFEWQSFELQDLDGNVLRAATPWEACKAWCSKDGVLDGHFVCPTL